MNVAGVSIDDTFAEAFPVAMCRLIVTAATSKWAIIAAQQATGYATSVIGCDAEAGIERLLTPDETPDARPGVSLLFAGFKTDALQKAVVNRVGQCIMTCPTTACFDGLPQAERRIELGKQLRYFGDGWQMSKMIADRRYWRVPVMDGEFLIEETIGTIKGVGGGNFFLMGRDQRSTLVCAEAAVDAISKIGDAITPFPGGVVRSGSKVGSKYDFLRASTNQYYCPSLASQFAESKLPADAECCLEIVIDGLSESAVASAMRVGINAACEVSTMEVTADRPGSANQPKLLLVSAGNYGGSLGPIHFHLHQLLRNDSPG